jgi:uncharacterized protein
MIPVCIFAKPFVPGKVKTRLAAVIGNERAASLAVAMFCDVWHAVLRCPGVRPILATVESGEFPVRIPPDDIWLQGEGDLGARIECVLRKGLEAASCAIAVGADSPLITPTHLELALQALERDDAVIGPSKDGGFYLLGLRTCPNGLLADLPWSSAETAKATRGRLQRFGMSVSQLESLLDIDTAGDLQLLTEHLLLNPSLDLATYVWHIENADLFGQQFRFR